MTIPYKFQLDGVMKIDQFLGRCLLAWDMGLGKTLGALWWLVENPTVRPVVVICPPGLRDHWEHEARTHVGMTTEIVSGTKPPKRYKPKHDTEIIISGYATLGPWLNDLKRINPLCVILDEVHLIKERGAQRSKHARELCCGVPHIIAISGTPLTNRPAELWNILNILRSDLFPSFLPYAHEYCNPLWTYWGWQYKGAKNLDKLHKMLCKHTMIRIRKQDVLADLPPLQRNITLLTLDKKAQQEYQFAERDFIQWLKSKSTAKALRAKSNQALVRVGYLLRLAATLKYPQVMEWIDNYLEDSPYKLAVYGVQKGLLEQSHRHYQNSVLINGATPMPKRQGLKEQFNNDPKTRLFFGNIIAAGTGISLRCPDLAFLEMAWTPGDMAQVEARLHGIGRGLKGVKSNVFYLIAKGTIEEKLCHILQTKQQTLSQTLDGGIQESELNVYDLLLASLKGGKLDGA